jgi:hypothetical protein
MPLEEHSAEIYRHLKVGNLESVKRDHFRPEVVPSQRPLTVLVVAFVLLVCFFGIKDSVCFGLGIH